MRRKIPSRSPGIARNCYSPAYSVDHQNWTRECVCKCEMFRDFENIAELDRTMVIQCCSCCSGCPGRREREVGMGSPNNCSVRRPPTVIESQSSELNIRTGEQPNWFWITGLSQQHHLNCQQQRHIHTFVRSLAQFLPPSSTPNEAVVSVELVRQQIRVHGDNFGEKFYCVRAHCSPAPDMWTGWWIGQDDRQAEAGRLGQDLNLRRVSQSVTLRRPQFQFN